MSQDNIPRVFEFDEMVTHLLERTEMLSREDVVVAASWLGGDSYPALLAALWVEGLVDQDAMPYCVPEAWSVCEFPNLALDNGTWRELFYDAGFTVDGQPAVPPAEPMRLWRGALPEHRAGWSWTDDEAVARWFADRPHNQGRGQVWTAMVEPHRVLARIDAWRLGDSEWVVDADGLHIEPQQA